ncbi:MAG: hypothetical protein ACRDU5_06450 [Mycobacterium sp.]
MGLTWWPVAVAGFACLAVAIALAALLPMEQVRRQLRPLANTSRLTRLPEYSRLARTRAMSMIVTIVLLVLLFGAAALASARPSGWWWALGASDPPEDIMLCVGEPATEQTVGEFLTYFAGQARTFGTQRIGMTSPNRRVVPLTRDYQYAAEKFGDVAGLAQLQTNSDTSPPQLAAMRRETARFSPPVSYVDYAPSTADLLALCMTGFPSFESQSTHRRSVIYLGPGEVRGRDETRPSLFTDQGVKDMATEAGVQINALTPSAQNTDALASIVESTGGQFFPIPPGDPDLTADLDAIRTNPPEAALPAATSGVGWFGDSPNIPLIVALAASTLLCLALVVLRR